MAPIITLLLLPAFTFAAGKIIVPIQLFLSASEGLYAALSLVAVGAAYTSLASANTALLTTTSRVGQANSAGYLDGQIAELIVTNNLLSTADEEGLLYYLNQKWAIY